jgi:S1-C subfamily serine protease
VDSRIATSGDFFQTKRRRNSAYEGEWKKQLSQTGLRAFYTGGIPMVTQLKQCRTKARIVTLGIVLGLVSTSIAWGQGGMDLTLVVTKVEPSVVLIQVGNESLGSGFVVDATGLIATNYHVIAGAKAATVVFPADKDKKTYPVEGFVAILPSKDLALVRINPGEKKLQPLKLAENLPTQLEWVAAFGAPLGLSGSVSDGRVSAIRSGNELCELFKKMAQSDVYKEEMRYALDAQWIQITVPISPGNSGGPLVNAKGEVLGLNTWTYGGSQGQNLNFAISSIHLRQVLASAGAIVQPLTSLPPPPPGHKKPGEHVDIQQTLAAWKTFNRALVEFNEEYAAAKEKAERIPRPNPRKPLQGLNNRVTKWAAVYKMLAESYREFASKVKGIDSRSLDRDLVVFAVKEGDLLHRTGDSFEQLATSILTQTGCLAAAQAQVFIFKQELDNLRTEYDVLRINLGHKYNKDFPTVDQTEAADEIREWSDRSGQHRVQARLVGVEDDKAKLEKADRTVVFVPIEKFSEADRRLIEAAW